MLPSQTKWPTRNSKWKVSISSWRVSRVHMSPKLSVLLIQSNIYELRKTALSKHITRALQCTYSKTAGECKGMSCLSHFKVICPWHLFFWQINCKCLLNPFCNTVRLCCSGGGEVWQLFMIVSNFMNGFMSRNQLRQKQIINLKKMYCRKLSPKCVFPRS